MRLTLDVSAVPPRPAGAGRYIVELAKRLPTTDDRVTLLTRRGDDARWRDWSPHAGISARVPQSRPARLAYEALRAGRTSLMRESDVWHSPHYTMPRGASSPVVVTIHDMTFFTNPEWHERRKVEFFRRAIRVAARDAHVLVTVSEMTARLLTELTSTTRPIVVAPLGVDHDRFSREGERSGSSRFDLATPFILFVGTLEPRKGIDVLLSAFSDVASLDPDVELWLVGQTGWGVDAVQEQMTRHPYQSRIRRLDYVDDAELPQLYRSARVVAYPSRGEGFGLPVLEALACGAPVVTTRDTVMAEVAADTARLVPAGDSAALADELARALVLDDAAREHVAANAVARAAQFTWERTIAQHREAYALAQSSASFSRDVE